jgi:hypothetical protein
VQRAPVPSQQPRFSLVVCQLTGLKKFSDRNLNCSCIGRAHHFHNFTVHKKKSDAAGPLVQKACCSMESLTFHFQDVIVFGCLGWQIKVTLDPPSRRFGNEKALSAPHREHVSSVLWIFHCISITIELFPASDSARDLCPSESLLL